VGGPHGYRSQRSGGSRRALVDQPEQAGDHQRPAHVQLEELPRTGAIQSALAVDYNRSFGCLFGGRAFGRAIIVTRNRRDHGNSLTRVTLEKRSPGRDSNRPGLIIRYQPFNGEMTCVIPWRIFLIDGDEIKSQFFSHCWIVWPEREKRAKNKPAGIGWHHKNWSCGNERPIFCSRY